MQAECFHSCIFSLPYIVIAEAGISFSITILVCTEFVFIDFQFKAWFEMFSLFIRNQTYRIFFPSRIFSLPFIVIAKIGISFSVTDLVGTNSCFTEFQFFGIPFPWRYKLSWKSHSTKLQIFNFPKTDVIFTSIRSREFNISKPPIEKC